LVQKGLKTVGERFALADTASLTAWTLYNKQKANFGKCYVVARAYSVEQQNAGRAQAGFAMHLVYFIFISLRHNIVATMTVWRIRVKIIRTVLC